MSDVLLIKLMIFIVIVITNVVVGIVSYHHGYSDCIDDFDSWLTDLMEGR
jgi:hypothetical protein